MGVKRKRELEAEDMAPKPGDTPDMVTVIENFEKAWSPEMWLAALRNPRITGHHVSEMLKVLRTKNLTPTQVAAQLFDTFPETQKAQDRDWNLCGSCAPAVPTRRPDFENQGP